jgi:hypothetical protein
MPMTVLVEEYWREIADGLAGYGIPLHHVVLHADRATLDHWIDHDRVLGPSTFRRAYLEPYAEAAGSWLHDAGTVVDTTRLSPEAVARAVVDLLPTA